MALGVVVTVGVLGASIAHDNAAQILGFCSLISVSLLALLQQIKTGEKLEVAAVKVEEVKTALVTADKKSDAQMTSMASVAAATHSLVNGNMGKQLKMSAVALRRIAELTGHPGDQAAAALAEKVLAEHDAKQAAVDAKQSAPIIAAINDIKQAGEDNTAKIERLKIHDQRNVEQCAINKAAIAELQTHQAAGPMPVTIVPAQTPLPVEVVKPHGETP